MKCATYYSNLFPTRSGYKGLSPKRSVNRRKVDVKTCAGIGFGELAYVREKMKEHESKSMKPRVFPGVASIPSGYHGACLFLNLETMETVVRDHYSVQKIQRIESIR